MWLIGFVVYRLLSWLASVLPLRLSYMIADSISLLSYLLHQPRTLNLKSNLRNVLLASSQEIDRAKVEKLAIKATINFGRSVVDTLLISNVEKIKVKTRFEIVGLPYLDNALARKRGAVVATAHIGSWEIAGAFIATMGYNIATVAGTQFNRLLSQFVIESKTKMGIMVFTQRQLLSIFRLLKKGAVVVLHIDGDQFLGGIPVDFFKRKVLLPRGPAALAKIAGSPLLCAVSIRRKEKISIVFFDEIKVEGRSDIEIMQDVANLIEKQIASNPDQWLMFRKIWNSEDEDRTC